MKTYAITYRKRGRTHVEERRADSHFDAVVGIRQANQLKSDDIISIAIKERGKKRGGKAGTMPPRIIGAKIH
jgi:hypothetical protein